jgi:hypothetical protein
MTRFRLVSGFAFRRKVTGASGSKAMKQKTLSYLGLVYKYLPWALTIAYKAGKVALVVSQLVNGAANYRAQFRSPVRS